MKILVIQHVDFEGPGAILNWAELHQHEIHYYFPFDDGEAPPLDSFDAAVVMGGPMGVYDDHLYPWLKIEKAFLQEIIEAQKKIIGICLGSQLLAQLLRTPLYRAKNPEIGWHEVFLNQTEFKEVLNIDVPDKMPLFHWHGDAFDIPYGASRLAHSQAAVCQAFIYENILGILCHLEVTAESLELMLKHCAEDLRTEGPYIQTAKDIKDDNGKIAAANKLLFKVLDAFLRSND